jgi:hypothetical protein
MNKKKLIIICFSLSLMFPLIANATSFVPNVSIGDFIAGEETPIDGNSIGSYIKAIYEYLSSIIGLVAAVALVIGGVMWLTAGGSSQRVSQAKSWISGSLTGLVLVLLSWLILQTINPNLVSFTSLDVKKIEPAELGCCHYKNIYNNPVAIDTSDSECYNILTTSSRVKDKIATTTTAILDSNHNGKIHEYIESLNDNDRGFERGKNAHLGKCVIMGFAFFYYTLTPKNQTTDGGVVARMTKEEFDTLPSRLDSFPVEREFFSEKDFYDSNKAGPKIEKAREFWKVNCSGRGDGDTCKEAMTRGAVGIQLVSCYCYGGEAYVFDGKEGAICGNENSICIPDDSNSDFCDDWDHVGGRDCGDDLGCCEKSEIKRTYTKF